MSYKRLTTNKPKGNVETMLNYAHGKEKVLIYDEDGNEVDLTEYAEKNAKKKCKVSAKDIMDGACMECIKCPIGILYTIAVQAAELRYRLMTLEDKIEAGELIEPPCKVGDTVYIVGRKYRAGKYEGFINTGKFRFSDIEKLGDTVFPTKEAAEARLKELQEGKK